MNRLYDCIVIGAGLAGLTAAIHLQMRGIRVLLVERRNVAGGLCGTHVFDGHEFVMGCNDFGKGFAREIEKLGVGISFREIKSHFCIDGNAYDIPMDFKTLGKIAKWAPDLIRLASVFSKRDRRERYANLGPLIDANIKNPNFADFLSVFSYALGTSPAHLALDDFLGGFSKELAYGHDHPVIAEGGPAHLVQCMVRRFESLGGTLLLNSGSAALSRDTSNGKNEHIVKTSHGEFRGRRAITSEGRWGLYPEHATPGLCIGMFHLIIRENCIFPGGYHTLAYLPKNTASWLSQIESGELPDEFGFHVFAGELPPKNGGYPLNLYFMCPRGLEHLPDNLLQRIKKYTFEKAEILLPGFRNALMYERAVTPKQYEELYGLSSAAVKLLPPAGFEKPDAYEIERDIYHIGNSVKPLGEHTGGAVLSGLNAAKMVEKDLARH